MEQQTNTELTMEQQFSITTFRHAVSAMSREQAQEALIKMYRVYLERENLYQQQIKVKWGIGS